MILNYYELLNVGAHATEQQIEAAYREKIMKCDSDLMKQRYDTAYYHLTDGKRRYEYDRSLGSILQVYDRTDQGCADHTGCVNDILLVFPDSCCMLLNM